MLEWVSLMNWSSTFKFLGTHETYANILWIDTRFQHTYRETNFETGRRTSNKETQIFFGASVYMHMLTNIIKCTEYLSKCKQIRIDYSLYNGLNATSHDWCVSYMLVVLFFVNDSTSNGFFGIWKFVRKSSFHSDFKCCGWCKKKWRIFDVSLSFSPFIELHRYRNVLKLNAGDQSNAFDFPSIWLRIH